MKDIYRLGGLIKLYEEKTNLERKCYELMEAITKGYEVVVNSRGVRVNLKGDEAKTVLRFALDLIEKGLEEVGEELGKYEVVYKEVTNEGIG